MYNSLLLKAQADACANPTSDNLAPWWGRSLTLCWLICLRQQWGVNWVSHLSSLP